MFVLQFSEWMEGKIRLACVGASADPNSQERQTYSDSDRWMLNAIADYMMKHHPDVDLGNIEPDFIDLNDGRDFLKESKTYDMVALMRVFHPMGGDYSVRYHQRQGPGLFRLSSDHTAEHWNRRLKGTGAKLIFAFGDSTDCVTGEYVGPIQGYQGPIKGSSVSVWTQNS